LPDDAPSLSSSTSTESTTSCAPTAGCTAIQFCCRARFSPVTTTLMDPGRALLNAVENSPAPLVVPTT
jgi:hypothetical protein